MTARQPLFGSTKALSIDKNVASLFNVEAGPKKQDPRANFKSTLKTQQQEKSGVNDLDGTASHGLTEKSVLNENKPGKRKRSKKEEKLVETETETEEVGARTVDEMEKSRDTKRASKKHRHSKNEEDEVLKEDLYLQAKAMELDTEAKVSTKTKTKTTPKSKTTKEPKTSTTSTNSKHQEAEKAPSPKSEDSSEEEVDEEVDEENSDKEDLTHESLIHESLLPNQSEVDKALNTVFVGNVPKSVITDKRAYKEFSRFFSQAGKVQSIRFRSIAFSEILPRKVAFTLKKLHESRGNINAYVAFESREAAAKALSYNGKVFADYHLRVDSVAHPSKQDNKKCVFIGNMDFDESEESLWRHFSECGEIEAVRLVRDSKTNVGKGFGYVQFKDSTSVTKALLLDGKKMAGHEKPEKSRALRVSRAKTIFKKNGDSSGQIFKDKRMTADKKSQLGRARAIVGKAGKAKINEVIEGHRAAPGEVIKGLTGKKMKGGKKRLTSRSQAFKSKGTK